MFKKIKSFTNIKYLTKNKKYLNSNIANTEEIFDKNILSFFDDLSKKIFNFDKLSIYPDLASFGFFL